jgi:hypothetical protein
VARVLLQRPFLLLFADQAPAPHADDILRPGGMPRAAQSVTQLSIIRGVCVGEGSTRSSDTLPPRNTKARLVATE